MDFLTVHRIHIDNKVSTRTMLYEVSSLKKGYLGPAFVRLISCKPWLIPSRSEMLNWSREKSKFSFKTEIPQCTALNHHQKKSNNFVGFCIKDFFRERLRFFKDGTNCSMENREVMLNHSYGNLNIILLKLLKIAADGYSHLLHTAFRRPPFQWS